MRSSHFFTKHSRRSTSRFLAGVLTLWLLVGTACSLPGIWQPAETPALTPPAAAAPTSTAQEALIPSAPPSLPRATAVPLPPALVESSPAANSELGPRQPVILYFNQAMEKNSVEGAWQSVPPVAGRLKWLDDETVTFTPDQPLPADSAVRFTLSTTARAANGLALTSPVELAFRTSNGLKEIDLLPKPGAVDVDALSAVVATFNRPVVPLGADPSSLVPAFTLEPPARGRGEWLNTSTYIFYPEPALNGGVQYTAVFKPGLNATDGSAWAQEHNPSWTFRTARPKMVSVIPDAKQAIALDAPLKLTFNQPMNHQSVETNFSFTSAGGAAGGTFTWNENATQVTFTPGALLQRGMVYTLRLPAEVESAGGAGLDRSYDLRFTTVPRLTLQADQPKAGGVLSLYDISGSLFIKASAPLAEQALQGLVTFTPGVDDVTVYATQTQAIYISGLFKPSTDYTLRISSALKDKWGAAMDKDFVLSFSTSAAQSSLSISAALPYRPMVFVTPSDTSLAANATNINTVHIGLGSLSVEEFARLESDSIYYRESMPPADLRQWNVGVSLPADENRLINLPLNQSGGPLQPGLYYYQLNSPELPQKNASAVPALLICSRIHLELKTGHKQVLAWAVNLENNRPAEGLWVNFYLLSNGQLVSLGSALTDQDGLAEVESSEALGSSRRIYAVIGKPGESDFAMVASYASPWLEGSAFGFPTNPGEDRLHIYLYTDRPIYRPGQQVYLRAAVNQKENGRYQPAKLDQIHLKVFGFSAEAGGRVDVADLTLELSPYGTVNGAFQLPENTAPGYYSITVQEAEEVSFSFQVAEYRKPELEVDVAPLKPEMLLGDDLSAQVNARYYFGAPAANLKVQWTLTTRPDLFRPLAGYQSGDWDTSWLMPNRYGVSDFYDGFDRTITGGEGTTAQDGSLTITVPGKVIAQAIDQTKKQELTLEVTVTDESAYKVSNRAEITLHPAEFYIGVQTETWSGQAGKALGFSIQTVDWHAKESANRALQAAFSRVTWKEKTNWQPGFGSLFEPQVTLVASTEFATDARGMARLEYIPPQAGTYQLEVRGDAAVTRVIVWVGGTGSAPWPQVPDQQLPIQLDAGQYGVGQKASIFIPNPLGETSLALITVERSKVMFTDVVQISGNDYSYILPLAADYAPNAYITVTLLGKPGGVADFRFGIAQLNVRADALRLQVKIDLPAPTAQPGSQVTLKVSVKDDKGKPVQGEFSASLVDKAVLALRERFEKSIFDALYGLQPLSVNSSLLLSSYTRVVNRQVLAGGRGGGGGDLSSAPAIRSQFEDTAYWNASFETDASGQAQLSLKLPDNLTTWVILVRGLDQQRRVGEAERELVVSKDLLVRPVTPRFLVVGDLVELAAVLHNNTDKNLDVEVNLLASGVELLDALTAAQKLNLAARGSARVTWWVRVLEGASADLRFSVSGGGLQDAATPTWGALPIQGYNVPQTFSTAGVLVEAGERLEVVSLPRSITPAAGELSLELAPSLAAAILSGLKAVEAYPLDYLEAVLSRLFPNVRTYQVLTRLGIDDADLRSRLETELAKSIDQVTAAQNKDGGWGWTSGEPSQAYLSAYALLCLSEAKAAGMPVSEGVISKAQAYLLGTLEKNMKNLSNGEAEQAVFVFHALAVSGKPQSTAAALYEQREKLAPWARAMLALSIEAVKPGDERVKNLLSQLQSGAQRTATGAFWQSGEIDGSRITTPNFSTALVVLVLARLDPAAAVLPDAVRYLAAHRQACGCWTSAYEAAWVLAALAEVLHGTGEPSSSFEFGAALNGTPIASGKADGPKQLSAVQASVPLSALFADQPNKLVISHAAGSGRLYYRADLRVSKPVELAQPVNSGVSVTRRYYLGGQDCRKQTCTPIDTVQLSAGQVVLARLSVTVPKAMYYLALEDFIPAGMEIVDTSLETSQRVDPSGKAPQGGVNDANPFSSGWNWWAFGAPQIYDQRIQWMARFIQPGTYEITYRLTPTQVGEYRVIPARVYQKYFPEVQGTSGGAVFTVQP